MTRGAEAIVDAEDVAWLSRWNWHAHNARVGFYAARNATKAEVAAGGPTFIYLHHAILPAVAGLVVDHINRDPLDNRRGNLRQATISQNGQNGEWARGVSGYRGVHFKPARGVYHATLTVNGRAVFLGIFRDPVEAARAYDKKALETRGAFAVLNFPEAA